MASESDEEFNSRPAAKRVRSERDHSKADTKHREDNREASHFDEQDNKDDKNSDHKDDDWLALPPFSVGKSREGWTTKWRESCWCGKTAFVYDSDPLQVKFCHCEDCQRLHGAPFQHAAIFKKDNVRLDGDPKWLGFLSAHGEVHPLSGTPTPLPRKTSCRACGSPMFDEGRNMVMAFPPAFEFARNQSELEKAHADSDDQKGTNGEGGDDHGVTGKGARSQKVVGLPDVFKAQCHIFYERRVMDIRDGLPKWRKHKDTELMGEEERP